MSGGIQRYDLHHGNDWMADSSMRKSKRGEYVRFDAYQADMAAERDIALRAAFKASEARTDALDDAIKAVQPLLTMDGEFKRAVLAALRELRDGSDDE